MPVRVILFKQEGFYEDPIGIKPKFINDIFEFDLKENILKSGNLRAGINKYLVKFLQKVSSGKMCEDKDPIWTMGVEHID